MKKSLLAIAVFGTLTAFAGTAAAQSSAITIYGIVDAGLNYERGNPAGSVVKLTSGVQSGSRLGFRGVEDLGGGLSAKFVLETGLAVDTGGFNQGNLAFGRQSWVGLSGDFGTVALGRQLSPHYLALVDVDPFKTGLSGNSQNLITSPTRMSNTIKYTSPSWTGFIAELAYGLGETIGNNTANRQFGGSIGYANGPVVVKLAHHGIDDATGTDRSKNTLLAGVWNFNVATANIAVNRLRGLGAIDSRDYLIGTSVPFGPSTVLLSYIRKDDRSALNRDAHQWALGYTYATSKRTNFYTSFGRITTDNGTPYTVGTAIDAGSGDEAFNIGVRHLF
jgi:predicted porin